MRLLVENYEQNSLEQSYKNSMKSNQSIQAIELEKENWVGEMSPPFLVKVD